MENSTKSDVCAAWDDLFKVVDKEGRVERLIQVDTVIIPADDWPHDVRAKDRAWKTHFIPSTGLLLAVRAAVS